VQQRRLLWLLSGIALTAVTGYRFGTGLTAWISSAPWLAYAATTQGLRARLLLLGAVLLGVNLGVSRIVTEPVPFAMTFAYGVPGALGLFIVLITGAQLVRRWGWQAGAIGYACAATLLDWATFALSPAGTWGTAVVSQVNDVELLQLVAFGGPALISLLIGWTNGLGAMLLAARLRRHRLLHAGAAIAVLVLAHLAGAARLELTRPSRTVKVAGITTGLGMSPLGLPPEPMLARDRDALFDKTERALNAGAKLAVWNEVATVIAPEQEGALLERGAALARSHGADVVLAYGVVHSREPLRLDNVYAWLGGDGALVERYLKHHPVPGEGSATGTAALRVLERPYGKTAGAICYDYDFPTMSRAQGRLGAELVALPASDWAGIDPVHGQVARVRAIEGGFSVLRPVRWATSYVFDAYGRVRAALPAGENDGILLADAPVEHVPTLYARFGDWPAFLAAIVLLALGTRIRRRVRIDRLLPAPRPSPA
jgi:apolipoprotein N-acyltransferase